MTWSYLIKICLWVVALGALVGAGQALAKGQTLAQGGVDQEIGDQLRAAAGPEGADLGAPYDPRFTVVMIIRIMLGLLGTILLALIVYAGFLWMTAAGNSEQVDKAKTLLRNAVIGFVIVLSAYSLTIMIANIARGKNITGGGIGTVLPWVN